MDATLKIYRLMVGLVMAGVIWILFPFISLVLIMLVLSFIFTSIFLPAVDTLERRIHNRGLSVLLIVGSAIVAFTWFLGSFMSNFGQQIKEFSAKLQEREFSNSLIALSDKIQVMIPDSMLNLIPESSEIITGLQGKLSNVFQNILGLLSTTGNIIFIMVMTLIFTIIVLVEYYSFKRSMVRFIPNRYFEIGLRLIYNVEQQVSKFLMGQLFAAVTVALLSILGLFILNQVGANLTLIILIGIIAGFANLIPMVGPFVGMIPAILIAIMNNLGNSAAMGHYLLGAVPSPFFILDIILMFIIVQQIDNNFVTPIVVGESTGLHPMIVMIALLIGGILMGPLGMLFAVPAAGIIKVVIQEISFASQNSHLI